MPFSSFYPDPWWSSLYHHSCWRVHKSVLQLYKRKDFQHIMYSFSSVIFLVLHCHPRVSNRDKVKRYNLKKHLLRATECSAKRRTSCASLTTWVKWNPSEELDVVPAPVIPALLQEMEQGTENLLEAWGQPSLEYTVQSKNKSESSTSITHTYNEQTWKLKLWNLG